MSIQKSRKGGCIFACLFWTKLHYCLKLGFVYLSFMAIVKTSGRGTQISINLNHQDLIAIEMWLANKSHSSKSTYKYYLKQFIEVMEIDSLDSISLLHITAYEYWLNQQDYAPSTISIKLNILKSLIGFLGKNELISEKLAARISTHPVATHETALIERLLTDHEVKTLIAAATIERDRLLIITLVRLGLRASEITSLKWSNIRGNVVTLKGKGGKVRSLLIPEDLLADLKAIRVGDYLFCVSTGKPLTRGRLHQIVKELAIKAGINEHTSPHWLRHFHAVTAVSNGCPLHVLQQGLGHESLDTTKRYLHVIPGECSSNYVKI